MRFRLLLKMQLPLPGELPSTLCCGAARPPGRVPRRSAGWRQAAVRGERGAAVPWGPQQLRAESAVPGARRRSAEMSHRPPGALTRKRR